MKNILYITHEFPPTIGGAGTAAYDIVNAISSKFNVIVFTVSKDGTLSI